MYRPHKEGRSETERLLLQQNIEEEEDKVKSLRKSNYPLPLAQRQSSRTVLGLLFSGAQSLLQCGNTFNLHLQL